MYHGFHLFGIGAASYEEKAEEYSNAVNAVSAFYELDTEAEDFDEKAVLEEMASVKAEAASTITVAVTSSRFR